MLTKWYLISQMIFAKFGKISHWNMVSIQFRKKFKGPSFVVGGSKNLKLSTKNFFWCELLKNELSGFLLFSSVCYQDDLSDSERNEIASSTACNFNNSWLLYVKFSETINLCQNIWLIENWKYQLFLFLK